MLENIGKISNLGCPEDILARVVHWTLISRAKFVDYDKEG
jgi:hypothetical protein